MFVRAVFLFSVLAFFTSVLIALPAYLFNQFSAWQVWTALGMYIVFFAGTAWRGVVHGKLAKDKEDRQLKNKSGRLAFLIRGVGLLGVHVGAIYEFSIAEHPYEFFSFIGLVLMLVGLFVNKFAISALGKFWDKLVIKSDHRLVKEGIYSTIRHPIYTSYILIFVGYVALFQALISFLVLIVVCVVWFGNRIMLEETMLIEKFGEDYREYIRQTKRLFPFIY